MFGNTHIQIHYRVPGDWANFLMTALWMDSEGYTCRRVYHPQSFPAEFQPLLENVVTILVGLGEPWQATHVVATLYIPEEEAYNDSSDEAAEPARTVVCSVPAAPAVAAVLLSVNARRADGARKRFTHGDYPALCLTDAAVIAAFKSLTGQSTLS